MNGKQNFLEAIRFGAPEHVPLEVEDVLFQFSFEGITRMDSWTDRWGVGWKQGLDGTVPFPVRHPIQDIEHADDYSFPNPAALELHPATAQALGSVDRSKKLVMGHMSYLLFERAWALMGMENFLMALVTHPDECHRLLHGIAHYAKCVFERYLELGVDGITFSEDLGSQRALMMSPQMFREFFLPEYRYCFQNVLSAGKLINFHSCGAVGVIAGDLAEIGVSMLNPIQARANDLAQIKAGTMGRMALKGGIDTALLLTGTPQQVREETKRVLSILKPGGGYVCAPDQHMPNFPPENMKMLWQTAKEFGRY